MHGYWTRMLFIDYSSAFNTIVPSKLIIKLKVLGLNPALCKWVLEFLTGCPQVVKVGNNTSTSLILNTGPTRMRAQAPPVRPVHPWLRGHTHLQLNHQVCRWHNSSRPDYQQWRDSLQGEGEGPGSVVPGNNVSPNVNKTKELIVEKQREHLTYPHRRDQSGEGGKLQVPRHTHHWQPEMVHPHRQCGEEVAKTASISRPSDC